ncbi:MAG: hypothetical protein HYW07_20530 [Candidatus Latescibacteria bacterium]|nr:hypothetical protein [Candidatus Latescibacterota bacterium]
MGLAKRFAWAVYDHLWALIGFNLLWTLLSLPWLAAGALLAAAGLNLEGELALPGAIAGLLLGAELVLFAPPGLLLFAAGQHWAGDRPAEVRAILREVLRFALRVQLLGLFLCGVTGLLLINIFFYQRLGGWLGLILSGSMLWLLLALLLTAAFSFPVLLSQDSRVWPVVRQSFLLVLDNPRLAGGLLLGSLLLLGISAFTGVGLFCGGLAALALLVSLGFRQLCFKYSGAQPPSAPPRHWRELIRPWEH